MRRVVSGDVDAFEILVDRHTPKVRRLVARNVPSSAASEVAHDAFVAAYLSLPAYVESHPFERWLTRVVLRSCADYWRARDRAPIALDAGGIDVAALESDAAVADDRELCEWAIARLAREDREVLTLVYFEGLSMKECAAVLEWSESKVKVRAHRARLRLRALLEEFLADRELGS